MSKSWRFVALAMSAIALAAVCPSVSTAQPDQPTPPAQKCEISETILSKLPPGGWTLIPSPDGRHIAYFMQDKDGCHVVVDGVMGKGYDSIPGNMVYFSPDSKHSAYAATCRKDDKDNKDNKTRYVVVLDGKEGKEYDSAQDITFSPDSQRLAYHVNRMETTSDPVSHAANVKNVSSHWVIDGADGPEYDGVANAIFFSPDSKRAAYFATRGKKSFAVIDGQEGKTTDRYNPIDYATETPFETGFIFSPDSKHVAYVVLRDKKFIVVRDGEEGKAYEGITTITFSPDSQRLMYLGRSEGKSFLVVDGAESKGYRSVSEAAFSADSKHYAYIAAKLISYESNPGSPSPPSGIMRPQQGATDVCVVMDGVEGKKYYGIQALAFKGDSDKLIYLASKKDKAVVICGDKESAEYDKEPFMPAGPGSRTKSPALMFSPDFEHYAWFPRRGTKWFAVVDGVESPAYDVAAMSYDMPFSKALFSPDSKRFAYIALEDAPNPPKPVQPERRTDVPKVCSVVVDGVKGKAYDVIEKIIFSPDSKHIAYIARRGDSRLVVVDGVEQAEYGSINADSLVFSPDSKHLVYLQDHGEIVVDGVECGEYDSFLHISGGEPWKPRAEVAFDSPAKFRVFAVRSGNLYLVEVEIKE